MQVARQQFLAKRTVAAARPCCVRLPARVIKASASNITSTTSAPATTSTNGAAAPQPVVVNVPEPVPGVLSPVAIYNAIAAAGGAKAQKSAINIFVSGMLSGAYVGFGGLLTFSVMYGLSSIMPTLPGLVKMIGGALFPIGLLLVILTGTELYTGNTAALPMAIYEKKTDFGGLMHNWFWSYLGNFVGSLAMVAAVVATGVFAGNTIVPGIAVTKSTLPWATAFARSVLCNWLVCLAVWNATASTSMAGKILALWPPIMAFVTVGLEHSVANMFIIPLGMALGAKVTWGEFIMNNLLPVTLGNTFAGAMMVATLLGFCHGSLGAKFAKKSA